LLLQTEIDNSKKNLIFTLWGTSNGTKGSYSHPVVSRWIPYGDAVEKETTDLEPGKKNCQAAHRGAEASFTYTRTFADGTEQKQVFSSYYRPLPQICLVGVAAKTETTSVCTDGTCDVPIIE
jgi:hypothetical protein